MGESCPAPAATARVLREVGHRRRARVARCAESSACGEHECATRRRAPHGHGARMKRASTARSARTRRAGWRGSEGSRVGGRASASASSGLVMANLAASVGRAGRARSRFAPHFQQLVRGAPIGRLICSKRSDTDVVRGGASLRRTHPRSLAARGGQDPCPESWAASGKSSQGKSWRGQRLEEVATGRAPGVCADSRGGVAGAPRSGGARGRTSGASRTAAATQLSCGSCRQP